MVSADTPVWSETKKIVLRPICTGVLEQRGARAVFHLPR
jgi:hypothetical protein